MFDNSLVNRVAVGAAILAVGSSSIALAGTRPGPVQRGSAHRSISKAAATNTFYAGGATLPAIAYVGVTAATTTNPATSPSSNSVFGYFESIHSDAFSYCQTGSGAGKKVLDGTVPASNPCSPLGASANGFGSANPYADFAGSDTPVSQSEYTTFTNDAATSGNSIFGRGEFVQVPYIAGAVAIEYNNPDVSGRLSISVPTLCKIADGQITNWNQIPQNPASPTGAKYPARALSFVSRTDSSGTTFSFSNYLSAVNVSSKTPRTCTGTGESYGLNSVFNPANTTVSPAPSFGALPTTPPAGASYAGFLGGNGNVGVVNCITGSAMCYSNGVQNATGGAGTIGYVEAANALSSVSGSVNFADLHISSTVTVDPIKDLPTAAATVQKVLLDNVVGASVANGRPNPDVVALSTAPIKANCLGIVDPQAYSDPTKGYPILAVTNLEFSSAGNGTKSFDLQQLAKLANFATNFSSTRISTVDLYSTSSHTVTGTTGYSALNLTVSGTSSPRTIAGCIGS